ncbi:hypothetical protein [Candidatus Nanohalococcus occultus]|uniref:hypothetical protein n=1 Tax=Candidatus Nanohalococcus occultus TaxID=2978047 RepID=UPI0039E10E27
MEYSLQEQADKYTITIPKPIVESKGWEKGDTFTWELNSYGELKLNTTDTQEFFGEEEISDKEILEKMARHRGQRGDRDRKLVKVPFDNGYRNKNKHMLYALQGSPIKAFAVRKRNTLHFYERDGSRWGKMKIKGDVKQELPDEDIVYNEKE